MRNSEITTRVANNDVHVTKSSFTLSSAARNHLRAVGERFQVSRFSSSYIINKISEGIDDLSLRQLKIISCTCPLLLLHRILDLIQKASFPYQEH